MTVRFYSGANFGAPFIFAGAGASLPIMQACLVDGYGNQTVTITRSGGIATVTTPSAHGLIRGQKVTISGANQPEYNGEFSITVINANSFSYPVSGSPATPATGTITARLAGAGWSMPFTGSGVKIFRQGAGSNGFYLSVTQEASTAMRLVGYEEMTAVNVGTGAFPTETQFPGGLWLQTGSAVGSPNWTLVASEKFFIYHVNAAGTANSPSGQVMVFGDIKSTKPGDAFHTILAASTSSSASVFHQVVSNPTTVHAGHYIARSHTQLGGSQQFGKSGNVGKGGTTIGTGLIPYPNGADNGIHLSLLEVIENSSYRGVIPGVWYPVHNRPLSHGDIFSCASGDLAGKSFMALNIITSAQIMAEISDTW